ncbi:hypothetical protein CEY09_30465 [Achromobacter marplatensis]|uniref:Uncharacterized protein DUF4043 n=1 Tax=Achromobacter marplatensis TaxID=470868 RepID=A0ABX9FUV7_9BURK|nr:DUF4043 family protein [Achromobacter marplatensis]OWT55314.1 hypothetical protein CEY09_30465 [Achromobacter marplatensis]RBP10656.1 uncharacterized protein DUF4043 [Achromobacter marplatensis]CAB3713060.1 hypothetical protein LMG26219_06040 [Achromobacter marplatensis]
MAETTARAGLTPQIWDSEYFEEYVRENRYRRFMGTGESSIFRTKEDLSRKPGDRVTFAAVRTIGGGVRGNTVLEGNEAELDMRSMTVAVTPRRNAVVMTEWDEQKSAIDIRQAARGALKQWSLDSMRDDITAALKFIPNAAGIMVPYEQATEAEKDAFLAANADRVLFGAAKSNNAGNDWSASLANIDNTADKLTPQLISLAKRMAQTATPHIRPTRTTEDQEWFVMFANALSFRDLQNAPEMTQANRDARERNVRTNPLFTGGDLVWDGVIIREVPEIGVIPGVGAGGIDVGFNFLCGAGALGLAWAQRTRSTTDVRDYGFRHGVGIQEIRGIEKLMFGTGLEDRQTLVQNGVVSVLTAAVADA